jgi:hypothetical protein
MEIIPAFYVIFKLFTGRERLTFFENDTVQFILLTPAGDKDEKSRLDFQPGRTGHEHKFYRL